MSYRKVLKYLLFLIGIVSYAQTYTGQVVDENNLPIAYAEMLAKDDNQKIIQSTWTESDGNFIIEVNSETSFYLEINYLGYEVKKINPETTDLGTIQLKPSAVALGAVVAKGEKKLIEQKVDRLVFNVENSVASSGGNALDVLKITPSINVKTDGISIIGKQSVRVLIDDRIVQLSGEELVSYLSSIASDDVKNIEVITTPPAKYDAEGNSGLINIVLKKPKEDSWSNQIRTSYKQTTYPAFKLGNTFNYNRNKVQLFVSLDGKKGGGQRLEKFQIFYPNGVWKDTTISKEKDDFISGRLELNYKITGKGKLGFLYSGNYSHPNRDEFGRTQIYNQQDGIIGQIENKGNLKSSSNYNTFNIHYLQELKESGRKFSMNLDYFSFNNDKDRVFISQRRGNIVDYQNSNNSSHQSIKNYSVKIDMEHPLLSSSLDYGAKFTQTRTNNNVKFFNNTSGKYILDPNQTDSFEFIENIGAIYVDFSKNFRKKWQTKLGLRLENTYTKGFSIVLNQKNERNYIQLFPTAFINYLINESNTLNISYNRRINRPNFWKLNPFKFYINANSYAQGNPYLEPSIDNYLELKYIHQNKYISDFFIRYVSKGSGQISKIDIKENEQIYTQQNYYNGYAYGARQTILFNPFKRWNITNMIAIFKTEMSPEKGINIISPMQNGWNLQLYSNQLFTLNTAENVQAEVTFMASSKSRNNVYKIAPNAWLNIGFRIQLLDNNLQIKAQINDVFKSSSPDVTTFTSGVKQVYNIYDDNRYLTLGITYKFGNNKIRIRKRKLGNEDELNRTN